MNHHRLPIGRALLLAVLLAGCAHRDGPGSDAAPARERFCGCPADLMQNITAIESGDRPRFRVTALPAALSLDNRSGEEDRPCELELVGPAARPENLFFRYGRPVEGGLRVTAIEGGVRIAYPVRKRSYALISVETPLSPPPDPCRSRAGDIEIEVAQGARVRAHEPGLRVRSLGPATRVWLKNLSPSPRRIELILENTSERLSRPRAAGLENSSLVRTGLLEISLAGDLPPGQEARLDLEPLPLQPPFVVALAGDSRERRDIFRRILARIPGEAEPLLMIFTGDLTYNSLPAELAPSAELLASLPFPVFTLKGNHDTRAQGDAWYRTLFGPERYAFAVGPLFFVMLDSNRWDEGGYHLGGEQLDWLERELAGSPAPWKMIALHAPPFPLHGPPPAGPNQNNLAEADAERLRAIASGAGVAYVLSGHAHLYARTERDGVVYLTDGGGGAPLYGAEELPGFTVDTRKGLSLLHVESTGIREQRIALERAEAPER